MPERAEKDIQQENLDDLTRRYRNGYFLLYGEKDTVNPVILIQAEGSSDSTEIFLYLNDIGGQMKKQPLKGTRLVEVYPDRGLYNYKVMAGQNNTQFGNYNPVLYFTRKNRRQWSHGIRIETCHKDLPFGDILDWFTGHNYQGVARGTGYDWNTIYSLFNPWYPETWDEAVKYLEKNPSVALTKDFMLMHDFSLAEGMILTKGYQIIGLVSKDKIDLREGLLAQEVTDLIRRKKFGGKLIMGGETS